MIWKESLWLLNTEFSMTKRKLAKVALDIPYFDPLSYLLPEPWAGMARVGDFAFVPLRKKKRVGYILEIEEQEENNLPSASKNSFALKSVISVAKVPWALQEEQLAFLKWVARYYLCAFGEILPTAIPNKLFPKEKDFCTLKDWKKNKLAAHGFGNNHAWVWGVLRPCLKKGNAKTGQEADFPKVSALFSSKSLVDWEEIENLGTKNLKAEIVEGLKQGLWSWQWPSFEEKTTLDPLKNSPFPKFSIPSPHVLTDEQKKIWDQLSPLLDWPSFSEEKLTPFLLYGVTGSGKTEIYILAAKKALAAGNSALILVPEIGLTPQIWQRFAEQIPEAILVQHSALDDKSRAEQWLKALNQESTVVIGTRSSIFMPLRNLKLIVVDEEYDSSYRQQEKPFYNARDLAVKLGQDRKALVILGAATPSIESYDNAKKKKYQLLTMDSRPVGSKNTIELVELRKEKHCPDVFYLTNKVHLAIQQKLQAKEQVLIFLNRRGYASMLVCNHCEQPQYCPNCSIPFTWHQAEKNFFCHICLFSQKRITECANCQNKELHYEGIGTQRLEKDFQLLFPDACVLRIDRDSTQSLKTMEENFKKIKNQEVQIIIGTQMIAKGHDFPNIGLVVLPLADLGLNLADYRASERTYQLLCQVSGRGGRSDQIQARTLIQTYNPKHPVFVAVQTEDFLSFFAYEIQKRTELKQPPIQRQALVILNDEDEKKVENQIAVLYAVLQGKAVFFGVELTAPFNSPVYKVNRRFQKQILVRAEKSSQIHQFLHHCFWNNAQSQVVKNTRLLLKVDP